MNLAVYLPLLKGGLVGIVGGLGYGLTQYWKANGEAFDGQKLFVTCLTGAVVGLAASFTSFSLDVQYQVFLDSGLVMLLQNAGKALWRRYLLPWLQKIVPPVIPPPAGSQGGQASPGA